MEKPNLRLLVARYVLDSVHDGRLLGSKYHSKSTSERVWTTWNFTRGAWLARLLHNLPTFLSYNGRLWRKSVSISANPASLIGIPTAPGLCTR